MRALAAALLLTLVAISGCAAKSDTSGTTSATGTATATTGATSKVPSGTGAPTSGTATGTATTGTSSTTTTGPPAPNAPPTAALAPASKTGGIPLNVTFVATGSDPEGANLTFTLSFGDGSAAANGTLPANVTHSYTLVGNFTARLTVSDGHGSANATALVHAQGGAKAAGPVTFTQTTTIPCLQCLFDGFPGPATCASFVSGENGIDCAFFPLEKKLQGQPFVLTGGSDPDIDFWSACDPMATFVSASFAVGESEAGTIPDGAGCAVAFNFPNDPADAMATMKLTIG
ncbi:MAG TPA: PKD domain-containing protein [Candidatus Thermoplasmatota archaeon]|nr:PKD domain-containing protein [Candidatus Thermoplasmatota archaeon]